MVGWYDPFQLARTAVDVLAATIVGRHADYRLVEALANERGPLYHDYSCHWTKRGEEEHPDRDRPREEIWIDYVSDAGDGWNPTHAVASCLAQPDLTVVDGFGIEHRTLRGDLLIFGGDEVYPTAGRTSYKERLVAPYETALAETEPPHPHVFAMPGNHDWYDSLVAFTRLFCESRWFGGWRTRQQRSYFALKLPHGWWLLAPDVQLGSDIDAPQVEHFKRVAKEIGPDDRVVLCNAEPHWIYSKTYSHYDALVYNEGNLAFLERRVLGRPDAIKAFIAGDLHHYRRHEGPDGIQKITAGGGGAFLHPTHGADVERIEEKDAEGTRYRTFERRASWPDEQTSRRLCRRNLAFPFINPRFGFLPATLYTLLAWTLLAEAGGETDFRAALVRAGEALLAGPGPFAFVFATLVGFVLFTDTHSRLYRWLAGAAHGLAHLLAALFIGWAVTVALPAPLGITLSFPAGVLAAGAAIFGAGWLVGSFIMGLYLYASLNLFGRHANEAFSALRIQDWKHFLRLHIDREGNLTIYPIGLRTVARDWGRDGPGLKLAPKDGRATAPELIEQAPIRVGRSAA